MLKTWQSHFNADHCLYMTTKIGRFLVENQGINIELYKNNINERSGIFSDCGPGQAGWMHFLVISVWGHKREESGAGSN